MTKTIKTEKWHTEFVGQKVTAGDGNEIIIQRERTNGFHFADKEVETIYGGEILGYGFKEQNGDVHFAGICGGSIGECQRMAKHCALSGKWDSELQEV